MQRTTLDCDGRLPLHPLRVLRLEADTDYFVRMLSKSYGGLYTHWKGRSRYCNPDGCDAALHRTERFWKGYCAGEVWNNDGQLWLPICLELTSAAELDLRGRYARGQVWRFHRPPDVGKKKKPITATLVEETDPAKCGQPPDYMACLLHLYNVERIDLSVKNPMPARVMVVPNESAGPACLKPAVDPSPEEKAKVQEMLNQHRQRFRMPNGTMGKP